MGHKLGSFEITVIFKRVRGVNGGWVRYRAMVCVLDISITTRVSGYIIKRAYNDGRVSRLGQPVEKITKNIDAVQSSADERVTEFQ